MDIVSYCPLRVASVLWRRLLAVGAQESWSVTLVVKATYALRPGESPLALEQESPHEADEHWGHDARKSLRVASDLAPFKDSAEVLVTGAAYAPASHPVDLLSARVTIGDIDKTIEVVGDRAFGADGAVTKAGPFTQMPLLWERAAGGLGTSNPVGVRLDGAPDAYGMTPLPNLQPQGAHPRKRGDFFAPVGFGPMAPAWPLRAGTLGPHAHGWDHQRWSRRALPADFDRSYFNAAPLDQQQVTPFQADEALRLEGLHPDIPSLWTRLQPIKVVAGVSRGGAPREELPLTCDTVLIETDRALCSLVWRAEVRLWHREEAGQIAVWMEPVARRPPRPTTPPERSEGTHPFSTTLSGGATHETARKPVLPFSAGSRAPLDIHQEPTAPLAPMEDPPDTERAPATRAPLMILGAHGTLLTPPASPPSEPPPTPTRVGVPFEPPPRMALPFEPRSTTRLPTEPPPPPLGIGLPFEPPPLRPRLDPPPHLDPPPALAPPPWLDPPPEIAPPLAAPGLPAPPALIGPLAGLTAAAPNTPVPPTSAQPEERPAGAPAPPDDTAIPIEQLAAITAEIHEARSPLASILEAHGVSERAFHTAETRWTALLERESGRGGSKLRTPYDRAYLAAVEGFRGPITLAEYTRVAVALERGDAEPALAKLAIQRPALMPLLRVWTRKVAADPHLADESYALLAALREESHEEPDE